MNAGMLELAHPLDAIPQPSPLRDARERRDLTLRAVALRSGLSEQEIEWLEDGRIYRFPSQSAAILAAVVYATAIGIDKAEARLLVCNGLSDDLTVIDVAAAKPIKTVAVGRVPYAAVVVE